MKRTRGFTLIELAIVLVIITFLIGGLAMPLSAQIQARRIAETKKILEEAREAIIGYAMSNRTNECKCLYKVDNTGEKPLPTLDTASTCQPLSRCQNPDPDPDSDSVVFQPDPNTLETLKLTITLEAGHHLPCPDTEIDNIVDGTEDRVDATTCLANTGFLPWVTLGVASQDAWGNRLRYAVTTKFANNTSGIPSTDNGDLQVCSTSGCATGDVAQHVPVVVLSQGSNSRGARNINIPKESATPAPPDVTSEDELENINDDPTVEGATFVSRSPSKAGDAIGEFDDLVVWISAPQLRGRICPVGGCP